MTRRADNASQAGRPAAGRDHAAQTRAARRRPVFLRPPDGPDVAYEFFAPFAHLPGRVELCRIRSPTHGVFDTCIVLGASPAVPATVYVNSTLGAAFLAERYPECTAVRVAPSGLTVAESADGRTVTGTLRAEAG